MFLTLVQNPTDFMAEFVWLENVLEQAANLNVPVNIIGHHAPSSLYHDEFRNKYIEIVTKYQNIIKVQLFGHSHGGNYPILCKNNSVLGFIGGSFTAYIYNVSNGNILDYQVHRLNIGSSTEFVGMGYARNIFNLPSLNKTNIIDFANRMKLDDQLYQSFVKTYSRKDNFESYNKSEDLDEILYSKFN